jgi:hypothetical protein
MKGENIRIGIIGHRHFGDTEWCSYVQFCCNRLLAKSQQKYSAVTAMSALSPGADSVFAETALLLGINLESVTPFGQFVADFQEEEAHGRYQFLRSRTKNESKINILGKSDSAYRKSMEWLVFMSNAVVAIWDGREEGATGGTWEAVSLCKKIRKTIIHVDYNKKCLNLYFNEAGKYTLNRNVTFEYIVRRL